LVTSVFAADSPRPVVPPMIKKVLPVSGFIRDIYFRIM
jgi:hypothetical protein